jgi:starch-binding outer membrane protein, SusD/RagB family
MKSIHSLFFLVVLAIFIGMSGCKKFIGVPPPVTQLVTANVFDDNATATAAQVAIYTSMESGTGFTIEQYTGWSSDELLEYAGGSGFDNDLFTNDLTSANDANSFNAVWSNPYNLIYQENAIIQGLQQYSGVTATVRQQLTGEAEFVRAFQYFYLVNLFGDVPLITTTNYQVSSVASRTPRIDVYQQIIQDLENAEGLLSSNFLDATDTVVTNQRVRPTKWAALAMLARVYLYTGNWSGADSAASAVIANSSFFTLDSLDSVFYSNSTEAIWQLMPPPINYYTIDGYFFILTGAPNTTSADCSVSNILLNAFESGDQRRTAWVDSISVAGTTYYYPYKYKAGRSSTVQTEYDMVLRLAEQYLIRAEAEAEGVGNGLSAAIADLNIIRKRAGLGPTTASSQAQVLNAIQHERQVELFTEWGDRWFNLKRTNSIDSVMTIVNPIKDGSGWQSSQQFYPIPLTDVLNDRNLTQTPGY